MTDVYNIISQKYDIVVTNPPYLGSSRFNSDLSDHVNETYTEEKSDLSMAMFRHCIDNMTKPNGYTAFITTSSWFFLSSFEKLRRYIVSNFQFDSIVDFGTELFEGKVGHNPIVSWVTQKTKPYREFTAVRLVDYCYSRRDEKEPEFFNERNRYTAKQENFSKIPGMPVAYWVSENFVRAFETILSGITVPRMGLTTGQNDKYLRLWFEVNYYYIGFRMNRESAKRSQLKWFPYNKGGEYRKWYGNQDYVVNWFNDGFEMQNTMHPDGKRIWAHNFNLEYNFREHICWNDLTSGTLSFRFFPSGFLFDSSAAVTFVGEESKYYLLGYLNTTFVNKVSKLLNPTMHFKLNDFENLAFRANAESTMVIDEMVQDNIIMCKRDWDSFETSWDFEQHPLI